MNKYRVTIEGHNVLARVHGKVKQLGFYTTAFVEAATRDEASSRAVELVRADEELVGYLVNPVDDPPRLSIEEIEQVEAFEGKSPHRTNFAFYQENEN